MAEQQRIVPTPGYEYHRPVRILPSPDYRPSAMHNRALPPNSPVRRVEVEWCPVCLGRQISERMAESGPVWHCDTCGNEW